MRPLDAELPSFPFHSYSDPVVDTRTPKELLDIIEAKGQEVAEALAVLRM